MNIKKDIASNCGLLLRFTQLIRKLFQDPEYFYYRTKYIFVSPFYQKFVLPYKVKKIRQIEKIDVLFVLSDLGSWKTESLYKFMLVHPRFCPKLLLVPAEETPQGIQVVKDYLTQSKYKYEEITPQDILYKAKFRSDIIFYQKPYEKVLENKYFFLYHTKSLFCYVLYSFRNRNYPKIKKIRFIKYIWQVYAENNKVIEESVPVFSTKAKNMVNTGLPFMDDLLKDKSCYLDPWKHCGYKKRIIYAPHHTIESELYEYATFLEYCDFMLEMAEKYKNKVQWAFKPHPVLRVKLYKTWGSQKTDEYYRRWEVLENCQIAAGEYIGLFKHSDAMIHDCGSFKLEYLYTGNPVMFLQKGEPEFDYTNWQTTQALNLHYKGYNKNDIENFIVNVINGKDPLCDKRKRFVDKYLTPPHNKTACQNIINAILGEEEYAGQ